MPDSSTAARHRWVAPAVAFAVALTITVAAVRGQTHEGQARDDLVISVEDGETEVAENDAISYRVTVGNNTGHDVRGLELAVTTPEVLVGQGDTRWTFDVGAGGTAGVEVSGRVRHVPTGPAEIVVTACVSGAGLASACASDVDAVEGGGGGVNWLMVAMAVLQLLITAPLVVLVVAAAVLRRRRRRCS